ncbi:MAG: hypothetical protein GY769_02580 [bacterium]|nr:hypothetical protein [bacterium]
MRRKTLTSSALAFTLVLAVFTVGLFTEAPASAKGENVTFQNKGRFIQEILVAYGADGECSEMPTSENITLEPKQSQVVSSADSNVCWCGVAVKAGAEKRKITRCGEWKIAKPGRKVRVGS